jgi:hypothetical protein
MALALLNYADRYRWVLMGPLFFFRVGKEKTVGDIGGFEEVLWVMSEGNVVNRAAVPLVKLRRQRGRNGTELYSGKLLSRYSTYVC